MSEQGLNSLPPFLVFALPRSRTAWLARFLTYGPWACGHEEVRHCRSLEDVKSWFMQPFIGTVETQGLAWWRLLERVAPGARVVTIRRPESEVMESLEKLALGLDRPKMLNILRKQNAKLDQIEARVPGVLSVTFEELRSPEGCARVFEHCLQMPFDLEWWKHWAPINLQIDLRILLRYWVTYLPQLVVLENAATQAVLAELNKKGAKLTGPLVIEEESAEKFYEEGTKLFAEHAAVIGERADTHQSKNITLLRALDAAGMLQVVTARANGKMFGYLTTIVGPSLEWEGPPTAVNCFFYASPQWPGLGLKLQRVAVEALRKKGVVEVQLRAGIRGSGDRTSVLYRRMGAESFGEMYRIKLNERPV